MSKIMSRAMVLAGRAIGKLARKRPVTRRHRPAGNWAARHLRAYPVGPGLHTGRPTIGQRMQRYVRDPLVKPRPRSSYRAARRNAVRGGAA